MSILTKLFGRKQDDRAVARPLWHRTVEIAREKEWYRDCGVAYTVAGNAVENALGGKADDWLSTMLFVRYAF